jgi:3-oxoacyl-[acyl-carrier protein] reductase
MEKFGRVDILVNNAGITRDGLLMRMKDEDWDAVLSVNLKGAFLCSRAASKVMTKQRYGRIINIASVVGQMGNAGQANYCASKAGLMGLTKSNARELAKRNITVNAVAPGFIATAMTDALPEKTRQELAAQIPLERLGTAEDIANVVVFLAAERSGYLTGQVIGVNGGMYM